MEGTKKLAYLLITGAVLYVLQLVLTGSPMPIGKGMWAKDKEEIITTSENKNLRGEWMYTSLALGAVGYILILGYGDKKMSWQIRDATPLWTIAFLIVLWIIYNFLAPFGPHMGVKSEISNLKKNRSTLV